MPISRLVIISIPTQKNRHVVTAVVLTCTHLCCVCKLDLRAKSSPGSSKFKVYSSKCELELNEASTCCAAEPAAIVTGKCSAGDQHTFTVLFNSFTLIFTTLTHYNKPNTTQNHPNNTLFTKLCHRFGTLPTVDSQIEQVVLL